MRAFESKWWPDYENSQTPNRSTDKTDIRVSEDSQLLTQAPDVIGSADPLPGPSESSSPDVLVFPEPTTVDLVYPLDFAKKQAATLCGRYRQELDRWLEIYGNAGWTDDDAIRAAFRRAITMEPPEKYSNDPNVPEEVFD